MIRDIRDAGNKSVKKNMNLYIVHVGNWAGLFLLTGGFHLLDLLRLRFSNSTVKCTSWESEPIQIDRAGLLLF